MAQLALFLLGSPRVEVNGKEIHIGRRKALALLAYLAVTGERHRRDSLAALLWPEYDQSRARADLRRTLSLLNRILGEGWLDVDRETAGLVQAQPENAEQMLWLDVTAFRQQLATCADHSHPATEACSACVPSLEEAVTLNRGDFLVGFTLADSLAFDEWQFFQTQGLRDALAGALERLVRWYGDLDDHEHALEYARRWLALDPTHESAHRRLMRLYGRAGQRSAALRQYRRCLRVLEEQLGVPPAAETTALYERIKAGRARTAPAPPPLVPALSQPEHVPVPVVPPLFVARERELARLERLLEAALSGRGGVAFITGDPGQGKTSLMREFARRAMETHPELIVASGNCAYAGDPYLPFSELMDRLTGDVAGTLSNAHEQRVRALMPLGAQTLLEQGPQLLDVFVSSPSLLSRLSGGTATVSTDAQWLQALQHRAVRREDGAEDIKQGRIFQQFTQVLRSLATAHPLLLILDDLQWADHSSAALLFHLGRWLAGAGSRVLILGAYRPEQVTQDRSGEPHSLQQPLSEFKRHFGDVWIHLAQTDRLEGRRFVDALLDSQPCRLGEAFRARLFRRTQGHPLFTVELLRTMEERGDLRQDEGGRWVAEAEIDWQTLPARVEAVVAARVARLDEALRDILAVASVEGERFTAQVVAQIQGIPERELLRTLSRELITRHHLVREASEVRVAQRFLSRYRFSHILFQEHLYQALSDGERRLLHGEVGAALEGLYGERTDEVAVQLARHYVLAGQRKKAAAYSLKAAHRARLGYADQEAQAFYQQAVAITAGEATTKDLVELAESPLNEAPMLAALVDSGQLPPVAERLPERAHIQVISPVDGVGKYGGTWYDVTEGHGMALLKMILYDPPIRWKADYSGYEPGLLKAWEVSADGSRITWQLRKGVKWSDGAPFTSGDLRFWWEDLAMDPEVTYSVIPQWCLQSDGRPMAASFPDPYTVVMVWDRADYTRVFHVAQGFWQWERMMKPRHYLERFHPRYCAGASYEGLERADKWWQTPGYPTLFAWVVEAVTPGERVTLVRNPYYWKVDTAGNQLPYIDRLDIAIVPDDKARLQQAAQGEYSASFRVSWDPKDTPFLAERARAGGYHLHPGAVAGSGGWPCWLVNQYFNDRSLDNWGEIRDLLRDKRFRHALSHAMDRQAIIDAAWDGVGTPQQGTISPQSWHFASPEGQRVYEAWANAYVEHDPVLARRLLDEIGMVDRDGNGWRELPSGAPFQLSLDVSDWGSPAINRVATCVLAEHLNEVGIDTKIHDSTRTVDSRLRREQGLFMLGDCQVSELDVWTFPDWIFPVEVLQDEPYFRWHLTIGEPGLDPTSAHLALLDIFARGLAEPDLNKRHALVWEAVQIHIEEGPFFIGAAGDQAMPVVIADNFRGVPDLVILGPWSPGTPGNLHPEQFWIEQ
jgi:ABC-type transport system substrate-binding protein/DNA-binding SARP family transcriptional activator